MALRRKNTPEPYRNAEMSEWFKEHDWKSCVRLKRTGGSNPLLCATKTHPQRGAFFCGAEKRLRVALYSRRFARATLYLLL